MPSTTPSTSYLQQNDYRLLKLEIVSNMGGKPIDLTPQFIDFEIFETIFDQKMVGEVTILDVMNYAEAVPIVGNETISIVFTTPGADKPIEIIGKVYTVLGKARTSNEKSEVYKMRFVTASQIENNKKKICCSKKGTMQKIVSDIFKENFGSMSKIVVDSTIGKSFQFVFPYWSPFYSINWLADRCFSDGSMESGTPSCYVFYEDVDGFHFADIVKRFESRPVMRYRYEPKNPFNATDVNRYFELVQDYQIDSFFDRVAEYKLGMYSGYLMTHDITKKKMNYFEFDYHAAFDKTSHLNKEKLIPSQDRSMSDAKMGFMNYLPVQSNRFDSPKETDFPQNSFQNRSSILSQLGCVKMTLVVNGNSTLRLLDVIDFEIAKSAYLDANEKDWEDSYLSGRYLITSLRHTLHREKGYTTTIGISKDSLIKGIPDGYQRTGNRFF